jgi:hypothetical protein
MAAYEWIDRLRRRPDQDAFTPSPAAANDALAVRRRFAHLAALGETVGEWPNRTLQFMRRGEPREPYRRRGEAIGLKWRAKRWALRALLSATSRSALLRSVWEPRRSLRGQSLLTSLLSRYARCATKPSELAHIEIQVTPVVAVAAAAGVRERRQGLRPRGRRGALERPVCE